jgi:hypothetical protein
MDAAKEPQSGSNAKVSVLFVCLGALLLALQSMSAQTLTRSADAYSNSRDMLGVFCTGNICRSPSAEAVFKAIVEREGVADRFCIDSCGTGGGSGNWYKDNGRSYHEGDASGVNMICSLTYCSQHLLL